MNDSREHILRTSLQLFLQSGFKEVTMKDIVEKTGLSKGAFYHYFSSKEQVFEEVISHFYANLLSEDYNAFSSESLYEFYNDYLEMITRKTKAIKKLGLEDNDTFTVNHYFLLFDAMKILPGFKEKHLEQNKEELKAWTRIISLAQKKGEITAHTRSADLAKLFVYASDGSAIHSIMMNNIEKGTTEIKVIWDALYHLLKL